MSKYFNYFPKFFYNLDPKGKNLEYVTNVLARFTFDSAFKDNTAAFYKYEVKDGETPETIAYKFYDSSERHWIILLYNDIIDPQYDWPMSYESFNRFVDAKYSAPEYADTANTSVPGIQWAKNVDNVKAYYKVITKINDDQTKFVEKIEIDQNTYIDLVETTTDYVVNKQNNILQIIQNGTVNLTIDADTISKLDICKTQIITKEKQTYYDYENELNESKRVIKLLKSEFVFPVEEEFKQKVNDGIRIT